MKISKELQKYVKMRINCNIAVKKLNLIKRKKKEKNNKRKIATCSREREEQVSTVHGGEEKHPLML